ncbi:uncharacterized protein LOC105687868 [Athalia rosae]|uniref:uncharacterized protein LOC105687868 n=1 Tax=Athalia rosae TaxID=37344 RepID=UPI00203406B5|nr:uncharacterized protein LOC105687868 [Athalia rosae]
MADRKSGECSCKRNKKGRAKSKPGKRKRQSMVYNPDEEVWHEPYLNCLRKEFSQISIPCDSKIELPWKDIAIPAVAMKIRANVAVKDTATTIAGDETSSNGMAKEFGGKTAESKESTGKFNLPWNDLLVMDTVVPQPTLRADGAVCDSTLEIPWNDLALERPIEIRPIPDEEQCDDQDIEIPWEEILIPANIVIETKKKKKHPSSRGPPTHFSDNKASFVCCGKPCHVKTGRK